jgi:pantoate--beta-alanine ligase
VKIIRSKDALRSELGQHATRTIGFAPTMGYLHEGHVSLFRAAAEENDIAVASIFVNPTQFAPGEDLDVYPRDFDGDAEKAKAAGIDILWAPGAEDVYAAGHSTTVEVGDVSGGLCGRSRPTHFSGVATVVAKLFNLVRPTRAYFGQKDFQQLAVIRRMVRDLDFPIEIVGMPIVRDHDGVALSSRNANLTAAQRADARLLQESLARAEAAFEAGERSVAELRAGIGEVLNQSDLADIDYVELVDPDDLRPLDGEAAGSILVALAVRFGGTRLIDNRVLTP